MGKFRPVGSETDKTIELLKKIIDVLDGYTIKEIKRAFKKAEEEIESLYEL